MASNRINSTLSAQGWTEVTINHVYHSFLKGELEKYSPLKFNEYRDLIYTPDFNDSLQNHIRFRLLVDICGRWPLLIKIPCTTNWYLVKYFQKWHIPELRVIGRCNWDSPTKSDKNEILKVIQREKETLKTKPAEWATPILWGHNKEGPFTILEGNHRFVAYAYCSEEYELRIPVFVGLSKDYCYWHILDDIPLSV